MTWYLNELLDGMRSGSSSLESCLSLGRRVSPRGYLDHNPPPSQDPTVALFLGAYGDPLGVGVFNEQDTPVLSHPKPTGVFHDPGESTSRITISSSNTGNFETWLQSKLLHAYFHYNSKDRSVYFLELSSCIRSVSI